VAFLDFKMKTARVVMALVLIAIALGIVKLILWVVAGWE
jgi:hypothetical protein